MIKKIKSWFRKFTFLCFPRKGLIPSRETVRLVVERRISSDNVIGADISISSEELHLCKQSVDWTFDYWLKQLRANLDKKELKMRQTKLKLP